MLEKLYLAVLPLLAVLQLLEQQKIELTLKNRGKEDWL
jgi:hypothetical protein